MKVEIKMDCKMLKKKKLVLISNRASIVGSKLILDYVYFVVIHMRQNTKDTLKFLIFVNQLPKFK